MDRTTGHAPGKSWRSTALLLLLWVATLAGFAGSLWWPCDLLSSFRPHYAVAFLVAALSLGLLRRWREEIVRGATPGCYPVALGINFAVQGLPARDAFAVHQYGVAAMILGAALRLMRIDHIETQRILYELNTQVDVDYEEAAATPLADMAGFAPVMEVLAAAHVKAKVRLFMS